MMQSTFIIIAVMLVLGGFAAFMMLYKRKPDLAAAGIPSPGVWVSHYGNLAPQLPVLPDHGKCFFVYGEPHYIYTSPQTVGGVARGRTISMSFEQVGEGVVAPVDGSPPPLVRLFLQRKGDNMSGIGPAEFHRLWSVANIANATKGAFQINALLQPDQWTGVYGKNPTSEQFDDLLANLMNIGWTHGGMFAGHGQVAVGEMMFVMLDYVVN